MGEGLKRREFLRGATAILAAGPRMAEARPTESVYKILSNFHFIGEDGKSLTTADIQHFVGNNKVTVNFGWSGCTDYCRFTNPALAALNEENPEIKHISINVLPEQQGIFPLSGEHRNFMASAGVNKKNVITLFPVNSDGVLDNDQVWRIAEAFRMPMNKEITTNHRDTVFLYDESGRYIDDHPGTVGPDTLLNAWRDKIKPSKKEVSM